MNSLDLSQVVQQFVRRYRAARMVNAGILGGLGVGLAAALGWRLHQLQVPAVWSVWVPAALGAVMAGGLVWWLRRGWISPASSAAHLDRALGLQQRLVTAAEFKQVQPPPALYSLLLEDAARHCAPQRATLPRPVNRTTAVLALLLLAILLWPLAGRSPLLQLAQLSKPVLPVPQPPQPSTPPPQPTPPPQSGDQQQNQQQQQQNPSQQNQSQQNRSQQSGGTSSQRPSPQQPSPSSGGQSDQAHEGAGGQQPDQRGAQGGQGHGEQRQPDNASRGQDQGQGAQSADAQGQQGQSSGAAQQQAQSAGDAAPRSGEPHDSTQPQQASAQQQSGAGSAGSQLSPGEQQALKAEIQQLLKDVSGELQQIQDQLASAQDQPTPPAGTNTDPNLYEPAAPLDPSKGNEVPIAVQPDAGSTTAPRGGGGTGTVSDHVSRQGPRLQDDEAQLSDRPVDETPGGRQVVPPEYRDVFDRLNRNATSP